MPKTSLRENRLSLRIGGWLLVCFGLVLALTQTACQAEFQVPAGYVRIEGGSYQLGTDQHHLNKKHKVRLDDFYIGTKEVTNREFLEFVEATGYVTMAEKRKDAKVFYPGLAEFRWEDDSTANWRYPNGKMRGGIEDKMDHPVTAISFVDVQAYCDWAGVRLPTLDEWEVAAGRVKGSLYFWENGQIAEVGTYANIWNGGDHLEADTLDDYLYTSPAGSYAPNPNGLYDIYGNVFEFCADRPERMQEIDDLACARGGSWWCSENACSYFNSLDIGRVKVWASFSNQGFRVVKDVNELSQQPE